MLRPWYLVGVLLVFTLLFVFTSGNAASAALGYIVYGGYLAFLLKYYRGSPVVLDDLFTLDARWVYLAFGMILKWVLILLGLVVFIVPGVYLGLRFMFVELLILDKGLKPVEALRASTAMTEGIKWRLLGFSLVGVLCTLLGVIALFVGVLVSSIVLTLAWIHVYVTLQSREQPAN